MMTAEAEKKAAPIRPTAERIAKGGIIEAKEERGTRPKPWYARECLIDVYVGDKTITKRQAMAGYDFRGLWYRAHGSDVKAQTFEGRISRDFREDDVSDSQQEAIEKLHALAALYGSDIYNCLRSIVGMGETWSYWARARGEWPASGKAILRLSLNRHAEHLKLPPEPKDDDRRTEEPLQAC